MCQQNDTVTFRLLIGNGREEHEAAWAELEDAGDYDKKILSVHTPEGMPPVIRALAAMGAAQISAAMGAAQISAALRSDSEGFGPGVMLSDFLPEGVTVDEQGHISKQH